MLSNFQSPGEVFLNLFGYDIYYYGIILAFAIFVGFLVAHRFALRFYSKVEADFVYDYSPLLIIMGVLGARLYYCIVNFSYYSSHIDQIFNIRQGGLSVHGMIIFGLAVLYVLARLRHVSPLKLADVYFCGAVLAQSIGRWGNFFNSEAFGYPTDLAWGVYIPLSKRPLEYVNYDYFHPTFLYESILDFCVFIVLYFVLKKYSKKPGITACSYIVLYSIIRIFVESFRIDSVLYIWGLPVAQVISIVLIILAFVTGYFIIKRVLS